MAVRDPQTLDAVARSGDGVLTLVLTEDRPYTPEDTARLAEELRVKLNTYVYALRSGQVQERRDGEPVAVVLHCVSAPPPEVEQVLDAARQVLAADGASVRWQLLDVPPRGTDDLLRDITAELLQAAPPPWDRLVYQAFLVGDFAQDAFGTEAGGQSTPVGTVPDRVRQLVVELKRQMWTPDEGTWLSLQLVVSGDPLQLHPGFNYGTEVPQPLPDETYAAELRAFPRPVEAVPDWWRRRAGLGG